MLVVLVFTGLRPNDTKQIHARLKAILFMESHIAFDVTVGFVVSVVVSVVVNVDVTGSVNAQPCALTLTLT